MRTTVKTHEDFQETVRAIVNKRYGKPPLAFGLGIKRSKNNSCLDVLFPSIHWSNNKEPLYFETAIILQEIIDYPYYPPYENGFAVLTQKHLERAFHIFKPFHKEKSFYPNVLLLGQLLKNYNPNSDAYQKIEIIVYFLFDKDQPVANTEEAYFKLQCLSQRHAKPNTLNLEGIFGKLQNIAWTNLGPILPEDLESECIKATLKNEPLTVSHVDKFPHMVQYHIPRGVRIASGAQVRLGAHCAEGTTVMPAGYINFNAGTLGNAMIEGRVSAGVVVGKDSDLGGGVSVMGTLSGGNKHVISIGEKCLLGANSGTGISLGFGCTIAAGVYVTAGAKIRMYDAEKNPVDLKNNIVKEGENIVKGSDLNGREQLLFLTDSQTGHLICRPNPKTITLNSSLHKV